MTHKQYYMPVPVDRSVYRDLHVGRALGCDLGYEGDDTGDSISEKNKNYCELTGLYWVWKNVSCDIVGVAHYRRYFITGDENRIIDREDIMDALKNHDIMVSVSCRTGEKSVRDNYEKWHNIKDLEICRKAILRYYPEDVSAFDLASGCNLFSGGNMLIAPKKVFDEYCEWLFTILFEAERSIDISGYDKYQRRVFGFLSERLMRAFLLAGNYRVKEMRVGEI